MTLKSHLINGSVWDLKMALYVVIVETMRNTNVTRFSKHSFRAEAKWEHSWGVYSDTGRITLMLNVQFDHFFFSGSLGSTSKVLLKITRPEARCLHWAWYQSYYWEKHSVQRPSPTGFGHTQLNNNWTFDNPCILVCVSHIHIVTKLNCCVNGRFSIVLSSSLW